MQTVPDFNVNRFLLLMRSRSLSQANGYHIFDNFVKSSSAVQIFHVYPYFEVALVNLQEPVAQNFFGQKTNLKFNGLVGCYENCLLARRFSPVSVKPVKFYAKLTIISPNLSGGNCFYFVLNAVYAPNTGLEERDTVYAASFPANRYSKTLQAIEEGAVLFRAKSISVPRRCQLQFIVFNNQKSVVKLHFIDIDYDKLLKQNAIADSISVFYVRQRIAYRTPISDDLETKFLWQFKLKKNTAESSDLFFDANIQASFSCAGQHDLWENVTENEFCFI